MNDFTKGVHREALHYIEISSGDKSSPHELIQHPSHHVECDGEITCDIIENKHDAKLYATAGTAATKLAGQGYDAIKLISLLPEIASAQSMNVRAALIKKCEVK